MHIQKGFTLVELMIVVVILAIIAAIALPSYQQYIRRTHENRAQDQIQSLAMNLENHKARQFNYLGFTPGSTDITLPIGAIGSSIKYNVSVRDANSGNKTLVDTTALGSSWAIKAEALDNRLYSYLLTSKGIRCKNKVKANITYSDCGGGGEIW